MADAAAVLAANGMANAAVIVQAAVMEGTDLAVAATLVAGESWGRHVWGHDPVSTGGCYVKGGSVDQANYLAYRAQMRAGKIGRQGCGISQATSAQYQDTADQLGGCWDMLANARSGFRGAQALIRRYGLRDGMRRYNGSGPAAERYADNFMARHATWQSRLAGATAAPAPAPAAPAAPPRPKVEPMLQNFPVVGAGVLELNVPIKGKSGLYGAAYISARSTHDNGRLDMWWGLSGAGGRGEVHWTLAANARQYTELTGGDVDQASVHYDLGAGVLGVITVEMAPK